MMRRIEWQHLLRGSTAEGKCPLFLPPHPLPAGASFSQAAGGTAADSARLAAVLHKLNMRLLPVFIAMASLCYLDR